MRSVIRFGLAPAHVRHVPIHDVVDQISFSVPFKPRVLHADDRTKVVLICLAPGQQIPAHADDNQGFFYVLEGAGSIVTASGELSIAAGELAIIERGGVRGLRAGDHKLVVLGTAVL